MVMCKKNKDSISKFDSILNYHTPYVLGVNR